MKFSPLVGLFLLSSAACAYAQTPPAIAPAAGVRTIDVSGYAEKAIAPDVTIIELTINSDQPNVALAQTNVAKSTEAIMAVLKQNHVEDKDIASRKFDCTPHFQPKHEIGPLVQVGMSCRHQMEIALHNMADAGPILADISAKDVNLIQSLHYKISDRQKREDELRAAAIADAQHKATLFAQSAQMKLGMPLQIVADENNQPAWARTRMMSEMPVIPAGAAAPIINLQPGEETLSAKVAVKYELLGN